MRRYENVKIDELIPYEYNARTHSEEQVERIAKSIEEFGFINPILVDSDYGIIAGHGRVLGAKKLGMDKLPCLFIEDLTDAQKKAYILADNKLALDAGWDDEILTHEFNALNELGMDINLTGFDALELEEFGISGLGEDEEELIEDEAPEVDMEEEPTVQEGEIWQLGRHRLMCGDSTSSENVRLLMGNEQADMLLTDPPYNVAYEGKTADALTIENDSWNDAASFRQFLVDSFSAADANLKAGGAFYIWHADIEGYNFRGACNDVGWKIRECLVWVKNTLVLGRQDYHWQHEPCLYGWKDGAAHTWCSDRKQTTVLEFDKPARNGEHPTMKPVALFDYQIKNNTKLGEKVLDLFGGSGTTIIACEQNGRTGYCMELDPRYCDVIIKRWENLTGGKAVKIN